jgi:outer membrane protein OmpA-like peptidoglycan-associated protein
LRFGLLMLALVPALAAALASAQVQNSPTTEPRGAEASQRAIKKGAAAITRVNKRCFTELVVNADALFAAHRWTLDPDAPQTLDVLGPMITKIGGRPTNIVGYTALPDSGSDDRNVDEMRAVTVRTWLSNHHYIPAGTAIGGLTLDNGVVPPAEALHRDRQRKDGVVWITISTCE